VWNINIIGKEKFKILYCSILLHFPLNYDQFSVLRENICQIFKFTFKILKLLKFLKVLKITRCFGQYGHSHVLKSSGGNCCYSAAAIACVPSMRTYVCNMRENFLLETSRTKILTKIFTHVTDIRAHRRDICNSSSFPPLDFNT
jgi:hypothetical protein